MKRTIFITTAASFYAATLLSAATLEWTGGGDGASLYQEANWQIQGGGAVSGDPLAPNAFISDSLIFTGTTSNVGSELRLSSSLDLDGGNLSIVAGGGMQGGTINITNSGSFTADWANSTAISINNGSFTVRGAGNPLTSSTITCTGDQWNINFTAETVADVQSEHLSKITVNGQPAVIDVNVTLTSDGATGSTITSYVFVDSDLDGLADIWEIEHFGNLNETATGDPDADQLDNTGEQARGTDPNNKDSDNDDFNDNVESGTGIWVSAQDTGTGATTTDTDNDGLPDGVETNTNVFVNGQNTGTNPHLYNSDNDRISDGAEVARGTNPNDANSQPNLPNVIFIMADDLGYNHLSSYGQTRLATPHIDALATSGMRFTNAYAGCTVCGPSRSSLMTGLHSGHIPYKVNNTYVDITSRTETLGEVFKDAGYMTGTFGKWGIGGLGSGQTPLDRGFDKFYGILDQGHGHRHFPSYLIEDNKQVFIGNTVPADGNTSTNPADRVTHTHDVFTDSALQFIDDQKDQAFFCYLSFTLPHTEIIASDEVLNTPEFDPANWPESYTANISAHISQSQPHRNFGAEIRMLDNSVGAIVAKLDDLGLTNDTLIIFTSDNGGQLQAVWGAAPSIYFNANGILRGGKEDSYEGGLRVPMVAKWPGNIPVGTVSDHPCYFADILPTASELLSMQPPSYTDGISILPELTGNSAQQKKHRYLFWSHQAARLDHAVLAGKWKAVKRGNNAVELYDLDADPSETTNVASSNAAIAQEMQDIITREYIPDLTSAKPSASSSKYPVFP